MSKIPDEILRLTDDQLRQEMIKKGLPSGPITETTRAAYQKRLANAVGGSAAPTPKKTATPRKISPKKQSLAAMSSEEEEEEPTPPPKTTRNSTPPVRKTVLAATPVPPSVSSPERITPRKKTVKQPAVRKTPLPVVSHAFDTGSDSDGPPEQTQDTKRTTHSFWRQTYNTNSPPAQSQSPYLSEFGRQLSLQHSFNGHSRIDPAKKMPAARPESIDHSWTHTFSTKILPVLLALFFGYLAYCYMGMEAVPKDLSEKIEPFLLNIERDSATRLPVCKDYNLPGLNCVQSDEMQAAIDNLRALSPILKQSYIEAVCYSKPGEGGGVPGAVACSELEEILNARGVSDPDVVIKNIRVLISVNEHWGFRKVNEGSAILMTQVTLPLLCSLRQKASGFLAVFAVVSIVAGLLTGILFFVKTMTDKTARDEERKVALVNRIKDRMESTESTIGPNFLAIDDLKDELLGVNNVESMQTSWDAALEDVLKYEQKIRLETKKFGGEEVDCLVWVQSKSPKPSDRASRSTMDTPARAGEKGGESSSQASRDHPGMWQGQAFENVEGSFNSPPVSPTQCLKIRHMFASDRAADSDGVVDAILEKCGKSVNILHIKLDTTANECCVYMKTASQADAGRAFRALHGWWFDGNLVTVKFLRLERYHERFAEAIQACIPLRPSNSLKRSLQGNLWEDRQKN